MIDKLSLFVPANRPLGDVIAQLKEEVKHADYIKDIDSRTRIKNALFRALDIIKKLDKIPSNGIIIYTDSLSEIYYSPASPLAMSVYRMDEEWFGIPELIKNITKAM